MSSALAGSMDVFEELALPHLNDAYQTANALLWDQATAQEVVENAYVAARRSLSTGMPSTSSRVWLFSILMTTIRQKRRWSLPPWGRRRPSSHPDDEVLDALRRIPLNEAEPVLLFDVEGFTYAEIQQILDLPLNLVETRVSQGRLRLENRLSNGVDADAGLLHEISAIRRVTSSSGGHSPL